MKIACAVSMIDSQSDSMDLLLYFIVLNFVVTWILQSLTVLMMLYRRPLWSLLEGLELGGSLVDEGGLD